MDVNALKEMIEFLMSENVRLTDENAKLSTRLAELELMLKVKETE